MSSATGRCILLTQQNKQTLPKYFHPLIWWYTSAARRVVWTTFWFVDTHTRTRHMAWHSTGQRICRTACGQHQKLLLVAVSALLTPRHCRYLRLVGPPLATVPYRWLQCGHQTVCHQRLGPAPQLTFQRGTQVSPFSSVIWLTWRCPIWRSADVCVELCNSFRCRFCKVPPQLCDGSTLILTNVVVVAVVVVDTHTQTDRHVENNIIFCYPGWQ